MRNRENQYREGYCRSFEGKQVEWNGDDNVELKRKQVRRATVENGREMCGSVGGGGGISQRESGGMMKQKLRLGERRLPGI